MATFCYIFLKKVLAFCSYMWYYITIEEHIIC
nr:MAG TPA: hypothetical protein [Bacteriophage sp.]